MTNNQDSKNNNQPTNEEPQINDLRSKVKKTLKRFVNNKEASNKEMEIFDKTVSRRSFLGGTFKLSAVAALVGQGLVPSAFAARNPEFALPSDEMPILTAELKAEITDAASIKVTSDVVEGVLKHRHIEKIDDKQYEDTLEALNTVVRAQEDFQNSEMIFKGVENNINRTYGHPELVRLQKSQLSDDSSYMHNGHELILYEYNTNQTAPVKKRTIQLPAAYPENLVLDFTQKGSSSLVLRKGEEIHNKYFRLIYVQDTGRIEVFTRKTDEHASQFCWTLFDGSNPSVECLAIQPNGRIALYDKKGKFLRDYSGIESSTKQQVKYVFTDKGQIELYSKGSLYKTLGQDSSNYLTEEYKKEFETYADADFDFNRVVSINGHKHNTISNNKVKNQKMILVAKQSVEGSWDGSPAKWIEHAEEMTSCWEQLRLYVQNSDHQVHIPEDSSNLKAVYDQGTITDTSGESWHVYNPLALLQKDLVKLNAHGIKVLIPRDGDGNYDKKKLKLTIEDIGKFESGHDFSCLYGTVKVNLWLNLGFYIYFDENQTEPVVKFISLNNKHRYEYLWWSDLAYNGDGNNFNSINYFGDYVYNSQDRKLTDSDIGSKEGRLSNAILRNGSNRSFIEQIFRPVGYFKDRQEDDHKKLLLGYECHHHKGLDSSYYQQTLSTSLGLHFVPTDQANEFYIYDIETENHLNEDEKRHREEIARYIAPKEIETGKIYDDPIRNIALRYSLFTQDAQARPIFQFDSYNATYLNPAKIYHSGGDGARTQFNVLYESTLAYDNSSEFRIFTASHVYMQTFDTHISAFGIYAADWLKDNSKIQKACLSRSFTGAARYAVHTADGALRIFKQEINPEDPYAKPETRGPESGFAIMWDTYYTEITESNNKASATLRMLDWSKYASDHEMILVQKSEQKVKKKVKNGTGDTTEETELTYDESLGKPTYKYITKELVEQTWHINTLDAQVAFGEEKSTEHCENATLYDVEIQALNIYDKPCGLADNQSFEIRFAQPCYFEIFTQNNQRNVGSYAKRMESYFVKPDKNGRALVQVKTPTLDRLSGITLSYRIVDGNNFQSTVSQPLLRLKNDVDTIHVWRQINLAYNVHKRLDDQAGKPESALKDGMLENFDTDYINDDNLKNKIFDGVKEVGSKLNNAHNEQQVAFKQAPNILYRDNFLQQINQGVVAVNPMLCGAWTSQFNNQRLGSLSDIWHKICDFAIAVLNKIKDAINWVKNQLNNLLAEIANLGIPGISDIAKIAKGLVSLVAGVLNTVLDIAIMIVNILKYIFDFDVAQRIGKKITNLATDLMGFINVDIGLKGALQTSPFPSDFNQRVNGISSEEINKIQSEQSNINKTYQSDPEKPDNINFVQNTLDKQGLNGDQNFKSAMLKFQGTLQADLNNLISTEPELMSSNTIDTLMDLCNSFNITNPESFNVVDIFTKIKSLDFSNIFNELQDKAQEIVSFFTSPAKILEGFFNTLKSIKVPEFIATVIEFIFGVKFNNFLDIAHLFLGYPVMLVSVVADEMIKVFTKHSVIGNIETLIDNASHQLNGSKMLQSNQLGYVDEGWKKDSLQTISLIFDIVDIFIAPLSEALDYLSDDEKSGFSALTKVLDVVGLVSTTINVLQKHTKNLLKMASWLPISFKPSEVEGLGFLYNDFKGKAHVTPLTGSDGVSFITLVQFYAFNPLVISVFEFNDYDKLDKFKRYKAISNAFKLLLAPVSLMENINTAIGMSIDEQGTQLTMSVTKDIISDVNTMVSTANALYKATNDKKHPYMSIASVATSMACSSIAIGQITTPENS